MSKQSSIDFLEREIKEYMEKPWLMKFLDKGLDGIIEQAKAMHKEEIIQTYWNGITPPKDKIKRERYYTKTFGGEI